MTEALHQSVRKRWALALVASAQFVLVLDITIVTVALPTIQRRLEFQPGDLQWLVTGYAMTFGGFLLLAGRAADLYGRRRMFVVGSLLFGAASLTAGLATNDLMLILARAAQGLAGAVISPAALALVTTTFPEGRERNRALGVFGAVASAGGASGLLLGGVITQWVGWRWIFLVNVPIAAAAAVAAPLLLRETRSAAPRGLDVGGSATISVSLLALVYGLTRADQAGFGDPVAVSALAAAVLSAAAFVLVERRAAEPLIPFRLLRIPTLLGTDMTSLAVSTVISSTPFFLTLYMQRVLDLPPLETGLAFLPMAFTIMVTSAVTARVAAYVGVKPLLLTGIAALILATLLLSGVSVDGSYVRDVLPGMTLFAIGLGCSYTTTTIAGTAGVADADQGIAGGLLTTFNQVGGAVGLAVLAAVATVGGEAAVQGDKALVEGLRVAFLTALGFAALAVVAATTLIREHDCQRELARRQRGEGSRNLPATVAGCLESLGGRRSHRSSNDEAAAPERAAHVLSARCQAGVSRAGQSERNCPSRSLEFSMEHHTTSSNALAVSATLHCLTGCAIGEISGLMIGTALGLGNVPTIALSVGLAFIFGYLLSTLPLLQAGLSMTAALSVVLAADTLSIATMEVVDNLVMVLIPGAMDHGIVNPIFWLGMAVALTAAFFAALPVNRHLLAKGKGHALTHRYHQGDAGHEEHQVHPEHAHGAAH